MVFYIKNSMKKLVVLFFFTLTSFLLSFNPQTPYRSLDINNFEQIREALYNPLQLYNYISKNFKYRSDTIFSNDDYWMTASDMFYRKTGDCEDWSSYTENVLRYHDYKTQWIGGRWDKGGHALCLFEWDGRWHTIGNTHESYEKWKNLITGSQMSAVYSNAGFIGQPWFIYTNGPPSSKLQYDNLVQQSFAMTERVEPQVYVSGVKYYYGQSNSIDIKINPYIEERDKLSVSYMNNIIYLHTQFLKRFGTSLYYDIS